MIPMRLRAADCAARSSASRSRHAYTRGERPMRPNKAKTPPGSCAVVSNRRAAGDAACRNSNRHCTWPVRPQACSQLLQLWFALLS